MEPLELRAKQPRKFVIYVRLGSREHDQLQTLANESDLRLSTMAREVIKIGLEHIATDDQERGEL